jgi:hypothetical protein
LTPTIAIDGIGVMADQFALAPPTTPPGAVICIPANVPHSSGVCIPPNVALVNAGAELMEALVSQLLT